MGSHTLRKRIQQDFPDADADGVIAVLEATGRTRTIARHVRDFLTILDIARGDMALLANLARHATDDDFRSYRSWLFYENSYKKHTPEYLQRFASCIIPLARILVPRGLSPRVSIFTLEVVDQADNVVLFVRPLLNSEVFVSKDWQCKSPAATREALRSIEGEFVDPGDCFQVVQRHLEGGTGRLGGIPT